MRGKYFRFGAVVLLLLSGIGGYVVIGLRLFSNYQLAYAGYEGTCDTLVRWSPPRTVYTGFYANGPALLTLQYRSAVPETLTLTVGIPSLTATQTVEVHASPTPHQLALKPPLLGTQALDALVGPRQRMGEVSLSVARGGTVLCVTSATLVLMSRQWMHWDGPPSWADASYFAGWVTPNDPTIAALVGQAASRVAAEPEDYPAISRLVGYDNGRATPEAVREQVDAVFDVLQFQDHLRYAPDNAPILANSDEIIQLPRDILSTSNPTGMCLETTAILASAVERLGMRPYVVLVPGHAFLGVALGTSPLAGIAYWETSDLNDGVTGDQANVHGDAEYASSRAQGHIEHIIDIAAARAQGIEPIG